MPDSVSFMSDKKQNFVKGCFTLLASGQGSKQTLLYKCLVNMYVSKVLFRLHMALAIGGKLNICKNKILVHSDNYS